MHTQTFLGWESCKTNGQEEEDCWESGFNLNVDRTASCKLENGVKIFLFPELPFKKYGNGTLKSKG